MAQSLREIKKEMALSGINLVLGNSVYNVLMFNLNQAPMYTFFLLSSVNMVKDMFTKTISSN